MISIPVHEKTEVVIDQIINYKFFCPNCGIVLHISKGFDYKNSFHNEKEFMFILATFENVFVNPEHFDTNFADIVHTHISNFEYISKIVDFEYFSLASSNDLFVRNMPEIKNCDVNFDYTIKVFRLPNWVYYNHALKDKYLHDILSYFGGTISDIKNSQIEGSSYKKEIFQEIARVINKFYRYKEVVHQERIIYPREEVYYQTVAYNLNKEFINKKSNYTFVAWNHHELFPTLQEIHDIANGRVSGKYSVKRVLRNINDPVRFTIGNFIGNYRTQTLETIKIRLEKVYRNFFNAVSSRRRIFIGSKENLRYIAELFKIKTTETFIEYQLDDKNQIRTDIIISNMNNNCDALFVICSRFYPVIADILIQNGFRENIDFIDGYLLMG